MRSVQAPVAQLDSGKFPSISHRDEQVIETSWRFRYCGELRAALLSVADWSGPSAKAVERFRRCGSRAVVQRSQATGRLRVVAEHCRNRWCPRCRSYAAARTRRRVERFARSATRLKLLTLTLKPSSAPLREQVAFLWTSFRRLRQSRWWRELNPAGIAVLETTRPRNERWHLHLHAVLDAPYIDARQLSAEWRRASRGSFIVDVRAVKARTEQEATDRVATYVASYVSKLPDELPVTDHPTLSEWLNALTRCHWLTQFGRRPPAEADPSDDAAEADPGPWDNLIPLYKLLLAARGGHPLAAQLLAELEAAREIPEQRGPPSTYPSRR